MNLEHGRGRWPRVPDETPRQMQTNRFAVPSPDDGALFVLPQGVDVPVPLSDLRGPQVLFDFDAQRFRPVFVDGAVFDPAGSPYRRIIGDELVLVRADGSHVTTETTDSGVLDALNFETGEFDYVLVAGGAVYPLVPERFVQQEAVRDE